MAVSISRSLLEQMSTEQLDELLRKYTESPEDGNEALCLVILDIIDQREAEAPTGRLPNTDAAWEEFQTYYLASNETLYPIGRDANSKDAAANPKRPPLRLRRILIAAALVAVLLALLIPPAFGCRNIFQLFGQWTDDTFRFVSEAPEAPAASGTESAAGTEWPEESLLPQWLPEGYTLAEEPTFEQNKYYQKACYRYTDAQGNLLKYVVFIHNTPEDVEIPIAEKNDQLLEIFPSNGRTFYIFGNGISDAREAGTFSARCADGLVLIAIIGNHISSEELKNMINSIGGRCN